MAAGDASHERYEMPTIRALDDFATLVEERDRGRDLYVGRPKGPDTDSALAECEELISRLAREAWGPLDRRVGQGFKHVVYSYTLV